MDHDVNKYILKAFQISPYWKLIDDCCIMFVYKVCLRDETLKVSVEWKTLI